MKIGICCLCGLEKELSFEHLPPKSIGNNYSVEETYFLKDKMIIKQAGSGIHSLCEDCNKLTGSLYVKKYKEFYNDLLSQEIKEGKLYEKTISFFPLEVFKEICCMFLSINQPPGFKDIREKLQKFILSEKEKDFPDNIKIYMYIQHKQSSVNRRFPLFFLQHLSNKKYILMSEFVSHGIGFILFYFKDDITPINFNSSFNNVMDITFFKDKEFNKKEEIKIKTKIFKIHSPFPFDFREKDFPIKQKLTNIKRIEDFNIYIKDEIFYKYLYFFDSSLDYTNINKRLKIK